MQKIRCKWAENSPEETNYHDAEWGVPVHDENLLFEFLILEGAQAGLSWLTVLKKRDNYRKAYDGFDPKIVANYDDKKQQELLQNKGIIRNRLKISSSISNAQAFLQIQQEFGSFDKYIWGFVDNKTMQNSLKTMADLPASTDISDKLSKDLKKRGFRFVGSTICYAMMQAIGMVNDHTTDCFCYNQQLKTND